MQGDSIFPLYDPAARALSPALGGSIPPTGAVAQSTSRALAHASSAQLLSGRAHYVAVPLAAGQVISSITFVSGTQAAVTPTNQWFSLYSLSGTTLSKLAVTNDDTSTAWAANSAKTLSIASPYTITATGTYYLGIMVAAGTVPSLQAATVSATVQALPPIVCGLDGTNTGLTTPATAPATCSLTAVGVVLYAYAS